MEDLKVYTLAIFISLAERAREDLLGLLLTIVIGLTMRPDARLYALMLISYFCYVLGGVLYQYIQYMTRGEQNE